MAPPRILYVDDDAGLRRLIERALDRRGFHVATADSADAGLARLQSETFDLVAIDHQMPGKNGCQMLEEIVRMPDHPPVVFVTGNDDTQVAVEALQAGALDFVIKTVGESFFDLLAGRFRQALSRADLESEKRRAEAELRIVNERLEMMLREVHHRVANSLQLVLSFVSMQANQTSEPAARDALEATQNRIRAIAKIHHRLYTSDDLSTIELDSYLRTLADELRATLAQDRGAVRLDLETVPCTVAPDTAVAIGVIVNELVSNAAKYAFDPDVGGTVKIGLAGETGGTLRITVADDGRGLDTGSAPLGTGLGTRIMTAIARSLDTTIETVPTAVGSSFAFSVAPQA